MHHSTNLLLITFKKESKMAEQNFTTVYLIKLSISNLAGLVDQTIVAANNGAPVEQSPLSSMAQIALTRMTGSYNALAAQINRTNKSQLTVKLDELDLDRDTRWTEIKNFIISHEKSRDAIKSEAAAHLHIAFAKCWELNRAPLASETALIKELFAQFTANSTTCCSSAFITRMHRAMYLKYM
jgi:hypothetical protein